jgi:hypothetical protein
MQKVYDIAITSLATLVIAFLIQFFGAYFLEINNGTILIQQPIALDQPYAILQISNQSDRLIDDLRFSVPRTLQLSELVSQPSIQISALDINIVRGGTTIVSISQIQAHQITTILLPLGGVSEETMLRATNYREKNFTLIDANNIQPPIQRLAVSALTNSIIYTILVSLWALFQMSHIERITKRFRERTDELGARIRQSEEGIHKSVEEGKELESKLDVMRAETSEIRLSVQRQKMILLARVVDYQKELEFWRDTIRKILYTRTKPESAEEILKVVTENLRTFHTLQTDDTELVTWNALVTLMAKQQS